MKKRNWIFVLVNIILLLIVYVIQPQCEPCIEGYDCPLCISITQIILLIGLFAFDVFIGFKYYFRR